MGVVERGTYAPHGPGYDIRGGFSLKPVLESLDPGSGTEAEPAPSSPPIPSTPHLPHPPTPLPVGVEDTRGFQSWYLLVAHLIFRGQVGATHCAKRSYILASSFTVSSMPSVRCLRVLETTPGPTSPWSLVVRPGCFSISVNILHLAQSIQTPEQVQSSEGLRT